MLAFVLFVGLISGDPILVEDKCSYAEFNTVFSDSGEFLFTQIIFWEWKNHAHEKIHKSGLTTYEPGFVVVDYRFTKNKNNRYSAIVSPRIETTKNGKVIIFWDTKEDVFRSVKVGWITRTSGQDSEQKNLDVFSKSLRRGLTLIK